MTEDNIGLDRVQTESIYDFKKSFGQNNDQNMMYNTMVHSCEYYELEEFQNTFNCNGCFSTLSLNIRSLPGKWNDFREYISLLNRDKFKFSIIAVQEVWNVPLGISYRLDGYKLFDFKVRDQTRMNNNAGGGIGFWVDEDLQYEVLEDLSVFESNFFESMFIKVKTGNNKYTIIGNVYRPNTGPRADVNRFLERLWEVFEKVRQNPELNKYEDFQLVGDFNLDLLAYEKFLPTRKYVDELLSFGILPLITKPTRIAQRSATILDHISTSYKSDSYRVGILVSDLSDHFPVFYVRNNLEKSTKKLVTIRKINPETVISFKSLLQPAQWTCVTNENRPASAFSNFFGILDASFEVSFPKFIFKPNKRCTPLQPWMTPGLLKSRKRKEKLATVKIKRPTTENIEKYKTYNSLYNSVKRQAINLYYKKRFQECKKDIKASWEAVKEVLQSKKVKENIPNYFCQGNNKIIGSLNIANGFNEFFSEIGCELARKFSDSQETFREFLGEEVQTDFTFPPLTTETLEIVANNLKPKLSCGPDKISSRLLKDILPIIIIPLCHVFNLSLQTGFIPVEFKIAKVVPIYKSGDAHSFTNYRPISLLSSLSKLLEKVVARQIMRYLNVNDILYCHQYGFRKGHSTTFPVIHFLNNIYMACNNPEHEYSIGIFLDLKKAFDTVDHKILLCKLKHYGFRGLAYNWFQNYLMGRKQYVCINGDDSEMRNLNCGIPQGSVLGPLLFILYINDLHNSTALLTYLFADDTSFQMSSTSLNNLITVTNDELKKVAKWFEANKLTVSISKTKYMIFLPRNNMNIPVELQVKIGCQTIERIGSDMPDKCFKFLGHILDDKLSWESHIRNIQSKISAGNFALARVKKTLPTSIKNLLYNSLIKSHLEYGILAWGGISQSKLNKLLNIQKKAIRNVSGKFKLSHCDPLFHSLQVLKIHDLYRYNCAVFMYKYKENMLPESFNNMFTPLNDPNRTLGYRIPRSRTTFLGQFPLPSLPRIWNAQPLDIKSSRSVNVFRSRLLSSIVDEYPTEVRCNRAACRECRISI